MTVKELKDVLNLMDGDSEVKICVNEPAGWICPDGATVDIHGVYMGIDWHQGDVLIAPKHRLDIHDVDEWSGKPKKEQKEPKRKKSGNKKEPKINGLTIPEYIKVMEQAHEATKNSTLVFK